MSVAVVTGGGNGIGAAIAGELRRQGWYVVTVDPMVSLDGSEKVTPTAPGAGDRAVDLSVTDASGVAALFASLADEFGRLDAVINVAGISRPTSFTRGSEQDWRAVLDVHLNGYLSVLAAALPLMQAAGHGRIVGVTSGSGWRAADTGAYGCAKRAAASLTWELGRHMPAGVTLNAMSPIAVTRMVTAALGRASTPASSPASTTGGLNLGSMPQPEEIGPMGAYLAGDAPEWMSGEILFAGGSESAVIERPRLLEVVRTDGAASLPHLSAAVTPALIKAEETQLSGGGSNPRFVTEGSGELGPPAIGSCVVVSERPEVAAALDARNVKVVDDISSADAVVLATSSLDASGDTQWQRILAEHAAVAEAIYADSRVARAVADARRPMRLVTLVDATTSGGRSRAQAAAQLARAAASATKGNVAAFPVAVEANAWSVAAELAAHLVCSHEAPPLSGAELVVGEGWFGLRSHPRPSASVAFGEPTVPAWFGEFLSETLR